MHCGVNMLNDDFVAAIGALKEELYEHPLEVEYLRYKKLIDDSIEIKELEEKIKKLQQQMTQNIQNATLHAKFKNEYIALKKEYDNHPYINNYNNLVTELNDLLNNLKTILDS